MWLNEVESLLCCVAGGHATEPGERDDDRHQWSGGLREAETEARDPAVPECQTGPALWTEPDQRHGETTVQFL